MTTMTLRDQPPAADPSTVHAFVDAQPGLTPAESAFTRMYLLRSTVAADTPEGDR